MPTPTRPQLATKAAADTEFLTWDQIAAEAEEGITPYELPVSAEETLLIKCPTGLALRDLARAQLTGDFESMVSAVFGDQTDRMWELAGDKGFPALNALINRVMTHYGRSMDQLGESLASSR